MTPLWSLHCCGHIAIVDHPKHILTNHKSNLQAYAASGMPVDRSWAVTTGLLDTRKRTTRVRVCRGDVGEGEMRRSHPVAQEQQLRCSLEAARGGQEARGRRLGGKETGRAGGMQGRKQAYRAKLHRPPECRGPTKRVNPAPQERRPSPSPPA